MVEQIKPLASRRSTHSLNCFTPKRSPASALEPGTPGSCNVVKFFLGLYRPKWLAHMLPCERAVMYSFAPVLFITSVGR